MSDYRELTGDEASLIARLLEGNFAGRDEIAQQVMTSRVRRADEDGCLEFLIESPTRAPVAHSVPAEAEAEDEDGVGIHALLHVSEGKVKELEFYKEDGTPIRRMPEPSQWRVLYLPPPPSV